jgi:hypothetical protein
MLCVNPPLADCGLDFDATCIRNASLGKTRTPSYGDRAYANGFTVLAEDPNVAIPTTSKNSSTYFGTPSGINLGEHYQIS